MLALVNRILRPRRLVLVAWFLAMAGSAGSLAAQTDVIRGRVINQDGQPVAGVRVTATSIPGNVTRSVQTNAQGNFQLAFPGGPGDYIMGYAAFGYAYRQFQVKRLADEDVLIANARLSPIQLDSLVIVAQQQQRVNRNQTTPDVSGTERAIPPTLVPTELMGDLAAMAASLPGVVLLPGLDGAADGFSVLGLSADQNSTTLNGLELGANGLPRDAAMSSSLSTSPFDVSRGGFSGGNLNIRSQAGSNYRTRGISFVSTAPAVQWADRAAQSLANENTLLSLGGRMSGPLKTNKAFYNVSADFSRTSRDNQTLLNTSTLGLETAGVAMDSVTRFLGLLQGQGVPTTIGNPHSNRFDDSGRLFGSIDFSPPNSNSGQSFGINFNGSWSRQMPTAGSALTLESASGDRTNWGGGVQARHSGYLGMLLSETSAGVNLSRQYANPFIELPSGRVRVNSVFENGLTGQVQMLTFGGNQNLFNSSSSNVATIQNTLSWFDNANKHRIKLSTELQYRGSSQDQASNLLGSFTFNSLADLEAGRPASFSRTLTALERNTGQLSGAISIGDSYRHSPDLQFQFGLRLDGSRSLTTPAYNALVESTFDRRNDRVPSTVMVSPRIGFSWTLGQANDIAAFTGAVRGPRAVVRGGLGVFANGSALGQINGALTNTGLPSGIQQIVCVGPAVPIPDWDAYIANPNAIPDQCADGSSGSVFSNAAPNVTLFANDFAPQRTVRGNLSWGGGILDARFNLNVEGTYSLNLNQQRSLDLNFNPTTRFTLSDGRPVFVETTSIVPATGSIASRDARVSQSFARVTELRSDLQQRTAQLSLRLSPIPRTPTNFSWNLAYTYSHIRDEVSGFSSTVGDPRTVEWARSAQGPHQINYGLRYRIFNAVNLGLSGAFRSGNAYTPSVAGDINGDGYNNDRAFVYGPTAADPALAAEMQTLLDNSSGGARKCLEKQLNRLAERNSCRGPWIAQLNNLSITLDRAKFRMPQRGEVSFTLSNPMYAADLLINGSTGAKGWGQQRNPDASLLYVRGFDPGTKQYKYEVNQRFGATDARFQSYRDPVRLTATVKLDLGPTRERQMLSQQLASGRSMPGSRMSESMYRSMGSSNVFNPMSTILRSQDSLRLTALQADSIASMNRRYTYRADSLWSPVAKHFASLPSEYDSDAAYDRYITARRAQIDMLSDMVSAVRDLLTSAQRRKLPASVVNYLDPRMLALVRNGTGMFVTGAGGGPIMMGGGDMMMMSEMAVMGAGPMVIIR
jgi:hypothetical protein